MRRRLSYGSNFRRITLLLCGSFGTGICKTVQYAQAAAYYFIRADDLIPAVPHLRSASGYIHYKRF